jgi:hypothetical protein
MILLRGPDMLSKRPLIFKSPFDFFWRRSLCCANVWNSGAAWELRYVASEVRKDGTIE